MIVCTIPSREKWSSAQNCSRSRVRGELMAQLHQSRTWLQPTDPLRHTQRTNIHKPRQDERCKRRQRRTQMPRHIVTHLHVVAQIPTETLLCILRVVRVDMAGAVVQQRFFHMMNLVAPGNPSPQVHILAVNEARIEAADLVQHALTKHCRRGNRPPTVVADGFCERPPIGDTRLVDELASIGIEQDVVAGDHICAGPPSLGKLPLELVWKPDIVVVQERDPLTSRLLDTEIAGCRDVSLVKGEIPTLVNGGHEQVGHLRPTGCEGPRYKLWNDRLWQGIAVRHPGIDELAHVATTSTMLPL
jgi:hypothetical protein